MLFIDIEFAFVVYGEYHMCKDVTFSAACEIGLNVAYMWLSMVKIKKNPHYRVIP